jgi:hypothetical protein
MTRDTKHDLTAENNRLRKFFTDRGLDLLEIWAPTPGDPLLENRQLRGLVTWVAAYDACPSRKELADLGYLFPPVEPDIDPDTDWVRFERWVRGEPTRWSFVAEYGSLPDAADLPNDRLPAEYERLVRALADRGVTVDFHEGVPTRLAYEHLREELLGEEFAFLAPGTTCHITGCTGYCPDCFQRPWCESGSEYPWPDDEEIRATGT